MTRLSGLYVALLLLARGVHSFIAPRPEALSRAIIRSHRIQRGGSVCLNLGTDQLLAGPPPTLLANTYDDIGTTVTNLSLAVTLEGGTAVYFLGCLIVAGAAGYLMFTTYSGDDGIGGFLGKEPKDSPFYKNTMKKFEPKSNSILDKVRLPDLDFVEVYNQPTRRSQPSLQEGGRQQQEQRNGNLDGDAGLDMGAKQELDIVAEADSIRSQLLEAVQAKDYDSASILEARLERFMLENGMDYDDK